MFGGHSLNINSELFERPTEFINTSVLSPNLLINQDATFQITGMKKEILKGYIYNSFIYLFEIGTTPCNWVVHRTYKDFLWLREILLSQHPFLILPRLNQNLENNKENEIKEQLDELNRFLTELEKINFVKNTEILFNFLSIKDYKQFELKKKELSIIPNPSKISDFKTIEGKARVLFEASEKEKCKLLFNFKNQCEVFMDNLVKSSLKITNLLRELSSALLFHSSSLCEFSLLFSNINSSNNPNIQMFGHLSSLNSEISQLIDVVAIKRSEFDGYLENLSIEIIPLLSTINSFEILYQEHVKKESNLNSMKIKLLSKYNNEINKSQNKNEEKSEKNKIPTFMELKPKESEEIKNSYLNVGYYGNKLIEEVNRINYKIYYEFQKSSTKLFEDCFEDNLKILGKLSMGKPDLNIKLFNIKSNQ